MSAAVRPSAGAAQRAAVARHEDVPEAPKPAPGLVQRVVDRIERFVHGQKHGDNPLGPNRVTHERPFIESKGSLFGLEFGLTVSELHQVRVKEGVELVHVVNTDGSSNLELVLGRKELGKGQRLEFQGPAVNTSLTPGTMPVGARFVGVGLTSDVVDPKAHEAVSYTLEVKATDRTALELASLVAPGAVAEAAKALGESAVGSVVAELLAGAVPIVSGVIAVSSARWAIKQLKNPKATKATKIMAVAHAISDAVRVVFPLAGTLGNAALVLVSAGTAYFTIKRARKEAAAQQPTGPPPAVDVPVIPSRATAPSRSEPS